MDAPTGLFSAVVTGIVIGTLARMIVPGRQAIGCLMTILVGLVGAAIGLIVASGIDAGWVLTLVLQVAVAAVLVTVVAGNRNLR
ncbi:MULTISPECIES: GlsB/YeaQ/YmgE family stress response membrane protein [unclassified Frankia]|uniref:GlsB/YeaQ/YmgE family stress response membrane protein n=1 Tax=unclassified Frankia TaxID=2632575 RepID=UPI002AD438DD|nr:MULTISPECIES: GlsB/YeaQ/YmgE family stress response membrane protein [unclassified Frankia]